MSQTTIQQNTNFDINNILPVVPRLNEYIKLSPTAKQYRFLCNESLDVFFGGPLTLDSLVLTPNGFIAIKDVSIGDIVLTPDGKRAQVIDIPFEGKEETYKITFSDNTFVRASAGHKWLVTTGDWRKTGSSWREKTTIELLKNYKLPKKGNRYKIPLIKKLDFEEKKHIISPYILGILLGDGTITKRNPIKITNPEEDIYNRVFDELIEGYHLTDRYGRNKIDYSISRPGYGYNNSPNIYGIELKRLSLLGCKAKTKFIPQEYLIDSKENRLSLLQGLMDTDGTIRIKDRNSVECVYSTISEKLKNDIIFLVHSLGGVASFYQEKRDIYSCYRININLGEKIFHLSRKVDKLVVNKKPVRMITNIKYIGKLAVKCITINHPDNLFITNSFIVTKNSSGPGKSTGLLMAALQYIDIPGYNAIIFRNTYANLSKPEGLMDVAAEWLAGTDAHWEGDDKRWRFPSGATLGFGYLDGPRDHFNYQGPAYQFIGIDELVQIRQNQALYMFSRMRKNNPETYLAKLKKLDRYKNYTDKQLLKFYEEYKELPLRFRSTSNPPQPEQIARGSWVKERYVNPETRKKGSTFIPAKLPDNPHLNKEEYIRNLNELDPVTRKQLLDGDWNVHVKGRMFDRSWFQVVEAFPLDETAISGVVRYWDMASTEPSKENKDPDYTVGCKMIKTKSGLYYITSIIRFRKTPRHNQQMIRQTADMDGKNVHIWMEQEGGSSGKDTIDNYQRKILSGFTFKGDIASGKGSKIKRAEPLASQAEAGNIFIVVGHWLEDFLEEFEIFPDGDHDDIVDAASGAFAKLNVGTGMRARWI